MANNQYIPAFRFHWPTNIYDWLILSFIPEKKFKSALLENATIQATNSVLDVGIGTAPLPIMAFYKKACCFVHRY